MSPQNTAGRSFMGDGIGFLKVMRGYFGTATVPVLVLTAIPDGDQARRATELGVKRVFRKADFQLAELLACVNEYAPKDCLNACSTFGDSGSTR